MIQCRKSAERRARKPQLAASAVLVCGFVLGCESHNTEAQKVQSQTGDASASAPPKTNQSAHIEAAPAPQAISPNDSSVASPSPQALSCPADMKLVTGGAFWVGTEREVYDREENPKFKTQVASFCADTYEVSAQQFESCVAAGKCAPTTSTNKTCNTVAKERGDHPINCIDYSQAVAVCDARGARLPTEIEWEYMARGGAEMRDYPWGSAHPDDNTCWKHAGSCKRGSYTEGAFGLHDVVGNVWEWTSSYWGHYPWPAKEGDKRVYRGGSWSRRFEKWMRPTLRNRLKESGSGSHLGVRCVLSLEAAECAYGRSEDGSCKFGVDEVLCLDGETFNGARCAKAGAERCAPGTHEEAGYGCVREHVTGAVSHELDTASVTRSRSPEFDADCVANSPGRPQAYRFEGGGHLARNAVGKSLGCKNRDVGVGFNSSCCP